MMKKILNMDGKKRITLGKLISKDTTYFEVEKKTDGTLVLCPKSGLAVEEINIYKSKESFSSLKKGIMDIKKGLVTKIEKNFWAGV